MEDKERAVIGIDPGSSTGHLCLLCDGGYWTTVGFANHTLSEWWELVSIWVKMYDCEAICENVHGMPGMGVASISSFMRNVGAIEMALAGNKIPTRYITPQTWMKYYGVKRDKDETKTVWKKRLREVLQQRLPEVKCTVEQADAVLIALYGRCTRV
jgi:hypothetical protein